MRFDPDLLRALKIDISRLVVDSRQVGAGDTFVAYPGEQNDGRRYIAQAIAQGANAVIWEPRGFVWDDAWDIPNLAVPGLREQAGYIAAAVYQQPSEKIWMIGVTGTNGKTSCSSWLARSFSALNRKCALIGTLGNGFPDALFPTQNTTPDALCVQRLLSAYVREGAQAVAMEVSSHALTQGRVNGVRYDVALFTNLTRDHLDYHGDMESYAAAKRRLFDWEALKIAVLNLDDGYGAALAEELRDTGVEIIGYGVSAGALMLAERLGVRMVFGGELQVSAQGIVMQVRSSWGKAELRSELIGRFNASNLLGSLAVLLASEVTLDSAVRVLGQQRAIEGRMQKLGGGVQPTVIVDYAHTPDALEKVLQTLREVVAASGGKVICVFGCGGDRDRGKRPMMGRVASRFADVSIVTNDNPRSENPREIISDIVSGMELSPQIIEDRATAIVAAVALAQPQDVVLIAGKGHEAYQEMAGIRTPFSDATVAAQVLRENCFAPLSAESVAA